MKFKIVSSSIDADFLKDLEKDLKKLIKIIDTVHEDSFNDSFNLRNQKGSRISNKVKRKWKEFYKLIVKIEYDYAKIGKSLENLINRIEDQARKLSFDLNRKDHLYYIKDIDEARSEIENLVKHIYRLAKFQFNH